MAVRWSRPRAGTPTTGTRSRAADGWYVASSCAEVPLKAPPGEAVAPGATNVEAEGAAFSPDGKLLATGGQFGPVRLWDLASGQQVRVLKGHAGWVMGLTF